MMRGNSNMVGFESLSPSFGEGFMDLSDEYYEKCDDDSFDFSEGLSHVHRSSALPISQSLPRGSSHNGPRLGLMGLSEPPRDNKVGKQLDFKKMQESEDMLPIDSIVVSPPPEWVLCSICQEIFKKPTITRCGHTFCYVCIAEVVSRKGGCPLCRQKIEGIVELNSNYQMKQVIGGLIVHCKYGMKLVQTIPVSSFPRTSSPPHSSAHTPSNSTNFLSSSYPISINQVETSMWCVDSSGCTECFEYGEREKHEPQCGHAQVTCFNEGCIIKVKRKDIEAHMADCAHRVLKCSLCGDMIQHQFQEKHELICPGKTVHCTYNCGTTFFRREAKAHEDTCPNMEIACLHKTFGCQFVGKRDEHTTHLQSCAYEGIKDYLTKTQEQMQQLMNITRGQQKEIKALKAALALQAAEITSLRSSTPQSQRASFRSFLSNPFDDLLQNHH